METHQTIALPHVDDSNVMSDTENSKTRVLQLLDQVESVVEKLRRDALKMEEDRDSVFTTLDTIRNSDMLTELSDNDHEDILRYAERIGNRCLTIEVNVRTNRDQVQEEALHQVNHLIDGLVVGLKADPSAMKTKCLSYMSACTSYQSEGITDKMFESAILGCTLDDQKRIKKRLNGLLEYINRGHFFPAPDDRMQ